MLACPARHMAASGDGLMRSAEMGPLQTQHLSPAWLVLRLPQAMHLRHGQRTPFPFTSPFFCSWACAWSRMTTRKAWANSARVMKRYHAFQLRTSY